MISQIYRNLIVRKVIRIHMVGRLFFGRSFKKTLVTQSGVYTNSRMTNAGTHDQTAGVL